MSELMRVGIIGGGLAGLSLGLALADIPTVSVRLFDKKSQPNISKAYLAQYDARSIALASGSIELFESIGLWTGLSGFATPIKQININRAGSWGRSRIIAEQELVEALGYVIEAPVLAQGLFNVLQKKPRVALSWDVTLNRLIPKQEGYSVHWSSADNLEQAEPFDLLVIADGLASQGCQLLGIERQLIDYGQQALVCNLDLAEPLNGIATEYFTSNGVIALLPLNEGSTQFAHRTALVWITDNQGQWLESMEANQFIAQLEAAISNRIKIMQLGKRAIYPLQGSQVNELVRANLIVMGSAAVGLHPVAAQGFNLALRDVQEIRSMLVSNGLNKQSHVGFSELAQYAESRQQDHARVRQFIHFLLKAYAGARGSLPAPVQSAGLALFDLMPGFKKSLAQFAMGARRSSPIARQVLS